MGLLKLLFKPLFDNVKGKVGEKKVKAELKQLSKYTYIREIHNLFVMKMDKRIK